MKRSSVSSILLLLAAIALVSADYDVTTPGFYYAFSGVSGRNPTLTIKTGSTVVFNMLAGPRHPMVISRQAGSQAVANIYEGQTPSSAQYNQPITVTFNEAGIFYYTCTIHLFFGRINVVDRLLEYTVTTADFAYAFEGMTGEEMPAPGTNPNLVVHRWPTTVIFHMAAAEDHPMVVSRYDGADAEANIWAGQLPPVSTYSGPLTVTFYEPGTFYYTCTVHLFGGAIHVVGPHNGQDSGNANGNGGTP